MREIKFRGKRKDNGEWLYGDLWHRPYGKNCIAIVSFIDDAGTMGGREIIPETLGQYTGLEDKSGIEIYEGDTCFDDIAEKSGKVIFDEGAFYFKWENIIELLSEVAIDVEVVGNIHEVTE